MSTTGTVVWKVPIQNKSYHLKTEHQHIYPSKCYTLVSVNHQRPLIDLTNYHSDNSNELSEYPPSTIISLSESLPNSHTKWHISTFYVRLVLQYAPENLISKSTGWVVRMPWGFTLTSRLLLSSSQNITSSSYAYIIMLSMHTSLFSKLLYFPFLIDIQTVILDCSCTWLINLVVPKAGFMILGCLTVTNLCLFMDYSSHRYCHLEQPCT